MRGGENWGRKDAREENAQCTTHTCMSHSSCTMNINKKETGHLI